MGIVEVLYIVRREDGHAFVHGSLMQRRAMMRMTHAYNPTWKPSWQPIKSTRVKCQHSNLFSNVKKKKNEEYVQNMHCRFALGKLP